MSLKLTLITGDEVETFTGWEEIEETSLDNIRKSLKHKQGIVEIIADREDRIHFKHTKEGHSTIEAIWELISNG